MEGVNVETVARVLNLTNSRVYQLAKEPGFPPKLGRAEFDLQKVTLWYIRYLQKELERRGPTGKPESAGIQAERLKLLAAQAVKVETENTVRNGELLTVDSVRIVWTQRVANTQKRLRSIPASLGPQLTNKSDPAYIADRLKREIDQALNELAGGPSSRGSDSGDGLEGASAAA